MERVADYVINRIHDAGSDHFFTITGRGILYLTDALARRKDITPVFAYNEQSLGYAAMAYSKARQNIAACLISTGCASTNVITACLCAFQDNLPIVFISGNNPREENTRYTGLNIRTYGSQETDIVSIVKPITKYAVMLSDAAHVKKELDKALEVALEGRKGPVWIDIPLDVQNMRMPEEDCKSDSSCSKRNERDITESVRTIAYEISKAERPILLIGGGNEKNFDRIKKVAEKFALPVVFTPSGADIYGSGNDLAIGALGSIGGSRQGNFAVQNSDYILAVGTKLCSQTTGKREFFARNAKIVVVDIDGIEHTKKGVHIDRVICADSSEFLDCLSEQPDDNYHHEQWINQCCKWKRIFDIENERFITELRNKDSIDIYLIASELSKIMPKDATVITDAGFEELIIPSTIKFSHGQRCLFPTAQGAMGYAIPAIIGAYFAGRKHIVCVVGDGSFMMNVQELQMIGSLGIPVKILVVNNNMYAVIRKRQRDLFRTRTIGNDPTDGVPSPNIKSISEGYGLLYRKIEKYVEMKQTFHHIFDNDNPELYEILSTEDQSYFHESYALDENKRLVHRPIEDMSPFLDRETINSEMIVPKIV